MFAVSYPRVVLSTLRFWLNLDQAFDVTGFSGAFSANSLKIAASQVWTKI